MNAFDLTLFVLMGVLVLVGLLKGMTRLLIGLGAFIAAFVLAASFHGNLAAQLTALDLPVEGRKLLAYAAIFLGTILAGGVLAWLLRKLLKVAMLSWLDRLAGGALGLVAALLLAALAVLPIVAYSRTGQATLQDSLLAPYVTVIADLASSWMPEELAESYRRGIEGLREGWRPQV